MCKTKKKKDYIYDMSNVQCLEGSRSKEQFSETYRERNSFFIFGKETNWNFIKFQEEHE